MSISRLCFATMRFQVRCIYHLCDLHSSPTSQRFARRVACLALSVGFFFIKCKQTTQETKLEEIMRCARLYKGQLETNRRESEPVFVQVFICIFSCFADKKQLCVLSSIVPCAHDNELRVCARKLTRAHQG